MTLACDGLGRYRSGKGTNNDVIAPALESNGNYKDYGVD